MELRLSVPSPPLSLFCALTSGCKSVDVERSRFELPSVEAAGGALGHAVNLRNLLLAKHDAHA
jgi:hypothetical protein